MKLENKQTLLFTGDSITDCARSRPHGEGGGLGEGYVAMVDSLLSASCPQNIIRVLNTGTGGDRVTDLEARWQADILAHEPDWLSVMIGINDVWRQFDNFNNPDQVDISLFELTYRKLLDKTRSKLKGLVLMTPFYSERNPSDPMRMRVDRYSSVVERLATEFDAVFVNVQANFDHYLKYRVPRHLKFPRYLQT